MREYLGDAEAQLVQVAGLLDDHLQLMREAHAVGRRRQDEPGAVLARLGLRAVRGDRAQHWQAQLLDHHRGDGALPLVEEVGDVAVHRLGELEIRALDFLAILVLQQPAVLLEAQDRALSALVQISRPRDRAGDGREVLVQVRAVLEGLEQTLDRGQLVHVLLQDVLVAV